MNDCDSCLGMPEPVPLHHANIVITGERPRGPATQTYDKPGRCFSGHVSISRLSSRDCDVAQKPPLPPLNMLCKGPGHRRLALLLQGLRYAP